MFLKIKGSSSIVHFQFCVLLKVRQNSFISLCKFEENVEMMTLENCNLFKRSFTTHGLGYTFNNEKENTLIKEDYRSVEFSHNKIRQPSLMKSTSSKYSLRVVIENNAEEIQSYENNLSDETFKHTRPREVSVSLHNPQEPGDTKLIPLTSIQIPLGQSTTFLISAKAREIDESGKYLTEDQRGCRLDEDTKGLGTFNIYTRVACLFECKMKHSMTKCGCIPWNFPVNIHDTVGCLFISMF